ncbi:hypothetical protein PPL_11760 [Heterostelium album PN500]|uniref:MHD domain-containing protein n=1 Tax=Heterostelium pallidum (strain ATCC 26659 / Pp 5 / PN500) TaxID=670386 RepID=D3BUE1_HETP5|nr:hypothetical protein PPL_11760 [Heterostelium album PN500]EFA74729.1 hypothetical protein PPL_11760 [Heterostelium album PN500]|eukprot:XP_020426863.1 hypothetical protein PPL_11760 [Heterostelium album PN500]
MFSQLFILNYKGDPIIFKEYRHDISRNTPELFFRNIMNSLKSDKKEMYFVLTSLQPLISPSLAFELLNRTSQIIQDYTGYLSEESIRLNFTLIYELLDELMDFGYPQATSTQTLKAFVFTPPTEIQIEKSESIIDTFINTATKKSISPGTANRPIHQPSQIDFNTDSIYVDLWEHLTVLLAPNGNVIRNEINGRVVIKSYLKNNPTVSIGFDQDIIVNSRNNNNNNNNNDNQTNGPDKLLIDDCNFHECAPNGLTNNSVINFHPPQGEFTLFNYRISNSTYSPFLVNSNVEMTDNGKLELVVKLRSNFSPHVISNPIDVTIPLPKSTYNCVTSLDFGGSGQSVETNNQTINWNIQKMRGGIEIALRAKIQFDSSSDSSVRREIGPINLEFDIPLFNCSNIQVKFLRVLGGSVPVYNRYITESKNYKYLEMNWNEKVKQLLKLNNGVEKAAVIDRKEFGRVVASENLEMSQQDINDLLKMCNELDNIENYISISISGVKYYLVQSNSRHIQAKSTQTEYESGLMIGITQRYLVVGIAKEKNMDLLFDAIDLLTNEIQSLLESKSNTNTIKSKTNKGNIGLPFCL